MNRATRLSLIAVMLLATTALGTIGYKTMYPDLPPAPVKETHSPPPAPKPSEPKPNPEYQKLLADLDQHERRCLQLVKQATILLNSQSQSQAEQRVRECWNLVEIERKYVKDFPAKTIQ
jgi:hypothetical protein